MPENVFPIDRGKSIFDLLVSRGLDAWTSVN